MPMRTELNVGIQQMLDTVAKSVAALLKQQNDVLVTAESCTAGLISATLARVPGVSSNLAGSFVVYQIASKIEWLGIPESLIRQHDVVSSEVARAMAERALLKTPHATVAIGITGHLGPDAPEDLDGVAWLGFAHRNRPVESVRLQLRSVTLDQEIAQRTDAQQLTIRHDRQQDAVLQSLDSLERKLNDNQMPLG